MSQANVEILERTFDAFGRGDMAAALRAYAADVDWDVSQDIWGAVMGGGRYGGAEGIKSWLRDLYGAWERFEMHAVEHIDVGHSQVVTVLAARGRGRASGIDVEHHPAGVSTLAGDKIVRVVWFPTRGKALEAVGFVE